MCSLYRLVCSVLIPLLCCPLSDPFELIVKQLNTLVLDWAQWAVNQVCGLHC